MWCNRVSMKRREFRLDSFDRFPSIVLHRCVFLSFIIFKTMELNAPFTRTALMSLSRFFDETNNVFCSTNLTRIDSSFVSNTSKLSVLLPSLTFPRYLIIRLDRRISVETVLFYRPWRRRTSRRQKRRGVIV